MEKQAHLAYDSQSVLGGGIIWEGWSNVLYWIDSADKTVCSLNLDTNVRSCWAAPDVTRSIGLAKDGGAVVGTGKKIMLWDLEDEFTLLAEIEPELPNSDLTAAVVCPDGCLLFGTKEPGNGAGRLYRCQPNGKLNCISEETPSQSTALGWDADRQVIASDMFGNTLYSYLMDREVGRIAETNVLQKGFSRGLPAGSCLDSEGYIWNCRSAGGGCIVRLSPEGEVDQVIDLPCSNPTSCTFGGEDLRRLYITSARFSLNDDHLKQNPQEGGVFTVEVDVPGLQAHRFG